MMSKCSRRCLFLSCHNNHRNKMMYPFPRKCSPERFQKWIMAVGRPELSMKRRDTLYVCEDHFEERDQIPFSDKKVLRAGVVPFPCKPDTECDNGADETNCVQIKLESKHREIHWQGKEINLKKLWTEESTKEFIRLRIREENLFTGKKNAAKVGWEYILAQLGLTNMVTVKQCKKKWTNLCQKYKRFAAERGPDGERARQSWPYYTMIEDYLTKGRSPRAESLRISSVRSGSNHSPGSSDLEGIEEEEEDEEGYLVPGEGGQEDDDDDEPIEEEVDLNDEDFLDDNFEPYSKRPRLGNVEGEMMKCLKRFDGFCRRSEIRQEESLNLLKEIVFLLQK